MNQHDTFDMQLSAAMRSYVAGAPVQIDTPAYVRALVLRRARMSRRGALSGVMWRYRWAILAGLLALALLAALGAGVGRRPAVVVVPTPTATPTVDTRGGLAFTRNGDLFLYDGYSEPFLVAGDFALDSMFAGNERWLYWSPDGQTLAIAVRGDTSSTRQPPLLLDWGSRKARPLPVGDALGSLAGWTPDSMSVLIIRRGGAEVGLVAVDASTGEPRTLSEADICQPVFSPDGRWIAASKGASNLPSLGASIVVASTVDFQWSPVGNHAGYDCGPWTGWDAPTWSADSERLAFISATETISVANRDGSEPLELTPDAAEWGLPKWSPDGNWICYRVPDGLRIIGPDGTDSRLVFEGEVDRGRVSWAPDSSRIDFGVVRGEEHYGPTDLWSYDLATGVAAPLDLGGPVNDFARRP